MEVKYVQHFSPADWTRRNWIWIATAISVAVGAVLRIRQYLTGRSLWHDEVMLASNILGRSYGDLLKPLDHAQGAPLGFLLIEKAVVNLLGQDEFALRLFPFLSGMLALLIFSHIYADNGANEEVLMVRYLDRIGGKQIAEFRASDAAIYLYEFSIDSQLNALR